MKAVIVDDEQLSIENIKSLLTNYCKQIKQILEARNITTAEKIIRENKPDIIFLDIEMPNGNGFDLINNIQDLHCNIIFITAFETYAVEAFRKNAIDYLLKPLNIDQLMEAVTKVSTNNISTNNISTIKETIEKIPPQQQAQHIKLPTMHGFDWLPVSNISYIKASNNYSIIYLIDGAKYTVSKTLGDYEIQLPSHNFVRIHREHIVNIHEIARYIKGRGGYVILKNNEHLDVSYRRKQLLLDSMDKL